jgi:hypothetical protein
MALAMGRPPKNIEIEIANKLRPYFEKNLSATFAAQKTGHNIKTVCNYFNRWSKEITKSENKDFFAREIQERQSIVLALDNLLSEEYKILAELQSESQAYRDKHKTIPKTFTSSIQYCIKTILELIGYKAQYTLVPASYETIDQCIQECLRKQNHK